MSKSKTARPVLALSAAVAVVGAALMTGAGASPAGAVVQSDAKAKSDRARRVCRTVTPTSSRLVRRVCRPQHEWDEEMKATQDSFLKHNFDQTRNGNRPGADGVAP